MIHSTQKYRAWPQLRPEQDAFFHGLCKVFAFCSSFVLLSKSLRTSNFLQPSFYTCWNFVDIFVLLKVEDSSIKVLSFCFPCPLLPNTSQPAWEFSFKEGRPLTALPFLNTKIEKQNKNRNTKRRYSLLTQLSRL